jgi:hypothetical protein
MLRLLDRPCEQLAMASSRLASTELDDDLERIREASLRLSLQELRRACRLDRHGSSATILPRVTAWAA